MIDTIVAKVQGVPGDDRCVLMLGYPDQMEKMMREANPGLARRFQLQDAWHFDDYSSEDLLHIMTGAAARAYGWQLDYPVLRAGVRVLDSERRKPNFGNAGAVNNLLAQVGEGWVRLQGRDVHRIILIYSAARSKALLHTESKLGVGCCCLFQACLLALQNIAQNAQGCKRKWQ